MEQKHLVNLSIEQIDEISLRVAKLYSEGIYWGKWNGSYAMDKEVDSIDIGDGIESLQNKTTWKKISMYFGKIPEIVVVKYFDNNPSDDYKEIIEKCTYKQELWSPPVTMARRIFPKSKKG